MELQTIDKQTLAALPCEQFSGRIELVQTPEAAVKAMRFLMDQPMVGFDTETRPNFRKTDNHKVSLLQLSTPSICFLIRLNRVGIMPEIKEFLETPNVIKVGLSTKDDFHQLNQLEAIQPKGFVELQSIVKDYGIGEASLTKVYALLFGKRISKGQRLSNWEAVELTGAQQHYAALDAYACLKIYQHLTENASH